MVQPSWWLDDPPHVAGVWQASNNAGGSYFAYTLGVALGQVVGPTGTQRFRRSFTVPVGVLQSTLQVAWAGDIHAVPPSVPSQLYIDGVFIADAAPPGGVGSATLPVPAPGVHTVEIWVGQATTAGTTRLDLVNAELFTPVPCLCCPIPELQARCLPSGEPVYPFLCCEPIVGATYEVDWSYAHRARAGTGVNTVQLRIGDAVNPLGTNAIVDTDATSNTASWNLRSGTLAIGAGFPQIRFEFVPVLPGGGAGNFLDSCSVILRRVLPTPFNFGEQLTNGGFELPVVAGPITFPVAGASVPGWRTTEPCNCFEYWRAASGVPPQSGNQFAELNVFVNGTVFQNATLETCENVVTYYDLAGNAYPGGVGTIDCP